MAKSRETNTVLSFADNSWFSEYKFLKFIYTWTIDGFQTKIRMDKEQQISSAVYEEDTPRKLMWQLQIKHNVHTTSFGIQLWYRGDTEQVSCVVEFSILKPDGTKIVQMVRSKVFNDDAEWFQYNNSTLLSTTNPMIFNDRLEVRFEIYMFIPNGRKIIQSNELNTCKKIDGLNLSQDYGQLLENESFSDVTLTVGSKSFRGHKAILTARSSVFAAMFQHDMLESKNNVVTITDIEPEVFQEVLRFIYTGAVGSSTVMDTMALELLTAADKYALIELQKVCAEHLTQSLTVETAAEALIMAELFNVADLKTRAIDFIKHHTTEVMLTSGWFKMAAYPELLKELAT